MNTVRRSLLLSMADGYVGLALQLASTVIIARILTPLEIGVFAVAAVFSRLASLFRDFGVAEYMIQEKELTSARIAAALSLNIIVSWSMALAMYFGAPFAAQFYGNPGVAAVMQIQALGFVLVPFGAVTMAYFRRELNFQPVLICNITGSVVAFCVAVGMALLGYGYISLAWSTVAALAVTVAGAIWFRPANFPRWPGVTDLARVFHFSKFASLLYIIGQVGKGAPEMIIGRVSGMVEVANFSRANGLVEMFHRLAMRPVMLVCLPYFAQAERERGSVVEAYAKSVSYVTAVGWPFLAFLGIAAFSAVRIVYGPQWDDAIPVAKILCAACALELLFLLSREALMACGDVRRANSLQIGLVVLQVIGLLAVIPWGLTGAAWGVFCASGLGIALTQRVLGRGIGLTLGHMLRACAPSAGLTLLTAGPVALWAAAWGVDSGNYITFGIVGGVITVLAWVAGIFVFKHPIRAEVVALASRLRIRRNPQG